MDGLALFDLLGSRPKTLHANPGGHLQIPPAEVSQAVQFLRQHLAPDTPTPARDLEREPEPPLCVGRATLAPIMIWAAPIWEFCTSVRAATP